MSDYKIEITTFGSKKDCYSTRGTIHIAGEEFPRKFVFYYTCRYTRPTGCDAAVGSDIATHMLRTNPPRLARAAGSSRFVRIFNEIVSVAHMGGRYNNPESVLAWCTERITEEVRDRHPNIGLLEESTNVTIAAEAREELQAAIDEDAKERALASRPEAKQRMDSTMRVLASAPGAVSAVVLPLVVLDDDGQPVAYFEEEEEEEEENWPFWFSGRDAGEAN